MENLIKFYEFNEQKLLDYDKETINKNGEIWDESWLNGQLEKIFEDQEEEKKSPADGD